jgi:hypothetical protein
VLNARDGNLFPVGAKTLDVESELPPLLTVGIPEMEIKLMGNMACRTPLNIESMQRTAND